MNEETQPKSNSGLIASGYVFAFLSWLLFPMFFAMVGTVIGIINITKGQAGHGFLQIILSIIFGFMGIRAGGPGISPF